MAKFDLSQFIQTLQDGVSRSAFQRIEDAINNLGVQAAAEPIGLAQAPPPLQGVNVKTSGEMVHITLDHNSPVNKGIHYFIEHDTDPSFPQPHVIHNGTSRTVPPFSLPTKDDDGNTVNYYFRAYPQLPGSHPAKPVNFGGIAPTPVTLTGTTQLSLLPSTGSGTAAANGQQGGYGFGRTNTRGPVAPKRNIPA